ncbi:hypothetical protein GCM10008941_31170 [Rhizomicrobium palustre]
MLASKWDCVGFQWGQCDLAYYGGGVGPHRDGTGGRRGVLGDITASHRAEA